MAGLVDALGPILELMTWVGFVPGLPLLVWGLIIARRRCVWTSTTGEVYTAGGFTGFRWTDQDNVPRQTLVDADVARGLVAGNEVDLHYDLCHPSRWSLGPPKHDNTVLILGWILTAVGILCTVGGFVLLLF
ncbi:hypothetical protein B1A87_001330 [Arthrobacter sp. KBS0703]|uniref:hypothetical protein n=1 Tax=Arthrobacter sp. KBS0703 TaxID=1955698 RepID=UPI00098F5682|nr:hypothetical protein [Arthrobacter sp. KBS0703]TSE14772.1 hypothetical protein B1A87_001330 [Arthrobacter sp. KBS0703]